MAQKYNICSSDMHIAALPSCVFLLCWALFFTAEHLSFVFLLCWIFVFYAEHFSSLLGVFLLLSAKRFSSLPSTFLLCQAFPSLLCSGFILIKAHFSASTFPSLPSSFPSLPSSFPSLPSTFPLCLREVCISEDCPCGAPHFQTRHGGKF